MVFPIVSDAHSSTPQSSCVLFDMVTKSRSGSVGHRAEPDHLHLDCWLERASHTRRRRAADPRWRIRFRRRERGGWPRGVDAGGGWYAGRPGDWVLERQRSGLRETHGSAWGVRHPSVLALQAYFERPRRSGFLQVQGQSVLNPYDHLFFLLLHMWVLTCSAPFSETICWINFTVFFYLRNFSIRHRHFSMLDMMVMKK
jgi:hypothetical protein